MSDQFYAELDNIMNRKAPPPPPEKPGILSNIGAHMDIGAQKYAALPIAGLTEIAGNVTGIQSVEDAGKFMRENAEARIAEREQQAPTQKFGDITSIADAGNWAVQQLSEMAPQIVLGMGTGGVGAAAGRKVATTAIDSGLATAEGIAGRKAVQAIPAAAEGIATATGAPATSVAANLSLIHI